MNNRIFSLALVCAILLTAIPAFSFPASAETGHTSAEQEALAPYSEVDGSGQAKAVGEISSAFASDAEVDIDWASPKFYGNGSGWESLEAYGEYLQDFGKITFCGSWSVGIINSETGLYERIARRFFFADKKLNTAAWDTANWGVTEAAFQTGLATFLEGKSTVSFWAYSNAGAFAPDDGCLTAVRNISQTNICAFAYEAPIDATYSFSYAHIATNSYGDTYFAICVDGHMVWPTEGGSVSDVNHYKKIVENTKNGAAVLNEALKDVRIEVKAGSLVQFAVIDCGWGSSDNATGKGHGNGLCVEPVVGYTATAEDTAPAPPVLTGGSVTLNEKFAANFFIDTAALPAEADGIGAYINGKFVAATEGKVTLAGVSAKQLADEITVQPTYTVDGTEVKGDAATYSVADMLMNYVTDDPTDKTSNLAVAMLNYAAAAQTFFGCNTENLANAGLAEAQKEVGYNAEAYRDGHTVQKNENAAATVYGIKPILGDTVSIAVYFNSDKDLTDGYTAVCKNGEASFTVKFVKTEGNGMLYKAVFEGFMPTAWNADLTFSVEKDGQTVSEALTYSLTDYCIRMQGKVENGKSIDPVVDAMLALYEAADEYNA